MFQVLLARVLALASLSTMTAAHLIMQQPIPYSADTLDNSPLANALPGTAESNFPCKLRTNAFEVTQENNIKVGEQNTISWKGSASHGGGTCQLSVTLDREPTAKSTFKVIASWIGGCPTSSDGNGGTHPFNWTMPPEVPNGKATFAWNWISKLSGQPEFYMNCAPITISGGASNTDEFDKLEDLFRVNLPSSNCGSQASHDLEIPNPGKYVTTFGSTALANPTGSGCAALGQVSPTVGGTDGRAAASSTAVTTSEPSVSSSQVSLAFPTSSGYNDGQGGSMTLSVSITTTMNGYTPATSSSAEAAANGSSNTDTPATGNGTGDGGSATCGTDGAIVCHGESQFGICNFGQVVWQDVAAGTTCQGGQIMRKRSLQYSRHVHHPHARSG